MREPIQVALIYGSVRDGRLCETVASWAGGFVWSSGPFTLDMIDPADFELPSSRPADAQAITALRGRLARADAFLVVTPEYNHGYPAPLKSLVDSASSEWHAKPVAFVSYGGISGGLRAVEQLRLVFAELHAVTIRDSVSFTNIWDRFDDDGQLRDPDGPELAMERLLASLHWWATALRSARRSTPYAARAA